MERDDSSRYVQSRTSLWCSVCGAEEHRGCKPVGSLRFKSHDENALGTVPRPVIPVEWVASPISRRDTPVKKETSRRRPASTPTGWLQ